MKQVGYRRVFLVSLIAFIINLVPLVVRADWNASLFIPPLYVSIGYGSYGMSYGTSLLPSNLYGYGYGYGSLPYYSNATYKPIESADSSLNLRLIEMGEAQKQAWLEAQKRQARLIPAPLPHENQPSVPEMKTEGRSE